MESSDDGNFSDDEVFFGKITLKEVKKRTLMGMHQNKLVFKKQSSCNGETMNDFKLIETSSQPDTVLHSQTDGLTKEHLKSTSDPLFNRNRQDIRAKPSPVPKNRDSFLEIEKCVVEQSSENKNNLDNTLEFVDFILSNGQGHSKHEVIHATGKNKQEVKDDDHYFNYNMKVPKGEVFSQLTYHDEESYKEDTAKLLSAAPTPIKCEQVECKTLETPNSLKKPAIGNSLNTPISNKKKFLCTFKTPKVPQSKLKSKAYEHIASPIALYIKNSPQVPLVKDVHPKKPLPSSSLIPKFVKNSSENKISDKENVVLPQLAYRSAKKTKVIEVDKEKLPPSSWAQKLPTSIQKPVVLKHNHRETARKALVSQQESFADLTLHQADVSICTQKMAFNKL